MNKLNYLASNFTDTKLLELFNEALKRVWQNKNKNQENNSFNQNQELIPNSKLIKLIDKTDRYKRQYVVLNVEYFDEPIFAHEGDDRKLFNRLKEIKTGTVCDWTIIKKTSNKKTFNCLKNFEVSNCPYCLIPKQLFNIRLWMLKTLFKTRIKLLKKQFLTELLKPKELIKDYEEIIEQLEQYIDESQLKLMNEPISEAEEKSLTQVEINKKIAELEAESQESKQEPKISTREK